VGVCSELKKKMINAGGMYNKVECICVWNEYISLLPGVLYK
jgi:hypothetical protein